MVRKRRLCSFRAIISVAILLLMLMLMLSRAKCKEIPNNGKISSSIYHRENDSLWNNEITIDEDDYYVGQSGFLHGSNSMLAYQMNNHTNNSNKTSSSSSSSLVNRGHRRSKRGVTHLYNMIICATGCNPLAYKGYGCYCGFLGSGYPMDGIDRCCKMHDWCYNVAECPMFVEYFVPYYWKCYHGYKPICAIEHGEWGGSGSCAQRLCECDRAFAECLRRYRCPRHKAVCTSSPWRLIQNLFMII